MELLLNKEKLTITVNAIDQPQVTLSLIEAGELLDKLPEAFETLLLHMHNHAPRKKENHSFAVRGGRWK